MLLQSSHQPLSPHFTAKDTEALSAVPSWVTQWSRRATPHSQMADPRVHLPDHQTPCLSFPTFATLSLLQEKAWANAHGEEIREQETAAGAGADTPGCSQALDTPSAAKATPTGVQLPCLSPLPGSATASSLGTFRQYPQHPPSSSLDSQPLTLVLHPPSHLPLVVVQSFFVPVPAPLNLLGLTNSCSSFKTQCICPLLPLGPHYSLGGSTSHLSRGTICSESPC